MFSCSYKYKQKQRYKDEPRVQVSFERMVSYNFRFPRYEHEFKMEEYPKSLLGTIYISRVQKFLMVSPYLPIGIVPGGTFKQLKIPKQDREEEIVEELSVTNAAYLADVKDALKKSINKSDSKELINAILFIDHYFYKMEKLNQKIIRHRGIKVD